MTTSKSYQVQSYYTVSGYSVLSSTDFSSTNRITFSNDSNAVIWVRLDSGYTGSNTWPARQGIRLSAYGGMSTVEGYQGTVSAMHTFPAYVVSNGVNTSTRVTKTLGVVIE